MQSNYSFSDSDEDDIDEAPDSIKERIGTGGVYRLQDIEKLKEQTKELLDPSWKESRYKHLIHKMLEVEQPTVTAKMVDFLLQDKVCDVLVGFITQNGSTEGRPGPNEQHGEAMKLAYRAVILLSPETIHEPLNALLTKKASLVAKRIFDVFLDDSAGSFYHAYRVLECLLRCFPSEVFDGLVSDGLVVERLNRMFRYIGYPPVCEMLVMLIALTPLPRTSNAFLAAVKSRWNFLDQINNWNILYRIARVMVNAEDCCVCGSYVSADQHSTAAAQLLQDLVEKLSLEDTGDMCLQSIGQNPALLDLLTDSMVSSRTEDGVRRSCSRILAFLLRRAAEAEIVCFVASANNGPPTASYVANRLYTLRDRIISCIRNKFGVIVQSLLAFDGQVADAVENPSVKYSSYEVKRPFTALRLFIVEVLVLCVESEETLAGMIPLELWKNLIAWSLKYAHNNVYHALFYRLIFAVLRQGQEAPQKILFQKAKFASFLVDNFVPYSEDVTAIDTPAVTKETRARRLAARGVIMNCANAIRLQISCQAPSTFLCLFFSTHSKWNEFVLQLMEATDMQMKFGMGIKVCAMDIKNNITRESPNTLAMLISEAKPSDDNIDVNARFARSLGFYDEGEWSLGAPHSSKSVQLGMATDSVQVDQVVYSEDSGGSRLSYLADENELSELLAAAQSQLANGKE